MTGFPMDPPLDGDWTTLGEETRGLLGERLRDFGAVPGKAVIGAIRALDCPCYADRLLCDAATETDQGPAMVSFIYARDGVRRLSGDSRIIHQMNEAATPDLSTAALQAFYLRFFCFFVHGGEGPFEILDDAARLAPGDFDPKDVRAPERDEKTGLWRASVLYGRSLFRAEFHVEDTGMVKMESDDLIAEGMERVPPLIFEGGLRRAAGGGT